MIKSNSFLSITFSYLGFSLTDGAIRVLVVLFFHHQGFSPFQIASLFLLYEIAGIFTNFLGGWIGTKLGLNTTLIAGMLLQVASMALLTVENALLTVPYIMLMQGFCGIAKDLVKMSCKSSLKVINQEGESGRLFKWVSLLTGSKNSMKGAGFLVGGLMLTYQGFQRSMGIMAIILLLLTVMTYLMIPKNLGKAKKKSSWRSLFAKSRAINVLSLARFFLFGSRDIWFVIALPVYLQTTINWSNSYVSTFLACWVIGYGLAQALVPKFTNGHKLSQSMGSKGVAFWTGFLILFPAGISLSLNQDLSNELIIVVGLLTFGVVFAVNSIIHSYLVLAYSEDDQVATDVGFYYMANACGRLVGTLLSGAIYQAYGFISCLWWSAGFLLIAALLSLGLPKAVRSSEG